MQLMTKKMLCCVVWGVAHGIPAACTSDCRKNFVLVIFNEQFLKSFLARQIAEQGGRIAIIDRTEDDLHVAGQEPRLTG